MEVTRYSWPLNYSRRYLDPMIERLSDFLNTIDLRTFGQHAGKSRTEREGLATEEQLRDWLSRHGGSSAGRMGASDARNARQLRDSLRSQLLERDDIEQPRSGTEANPTPPALHYEARVRRAELGFAPQSRTAGLFQWLMEDLIRAAADDSLRRLKICAAPECRWAFVDRSRNATRRWCSMRSCGNRHKLRRHRGKGGS